MRTALLQHSSDETLTENVRKVVHIHVGVSFRVACVVTGASQIVVLRTFTPIQLPDFLVVHQ
jgi:hypothetical protein